MYVASFTLDQSKTLFQTLSTEDCLAFFNVCLEQGLSSSSVLSSRSRYSGNLPSTAKANSLFSLILRRFQQPLFYLILVFACVSLFFNKADSSLLYVVIIGYVVFSVFQEWRTAVSVSSISNAFSPRVSVKRDGQQVQIDATELVPGDIMYLRTGQRVPADCRILEANDLSIDESALTGESDPVLKMTSPLEEERALGIPKNMGFSSTIVTEGDGVAVVTKTGDNAEIGTTFSVIQSSTRRKHH
ncbi:hypothetical protein GEMRC1_001290 [Eukaryota sp. GEM-RC1]